MATPSHLKKAPIVEAIIDFSAKLPSGFDPETLSSLAKDLSGEYPKSEPRRLVTGSIEIKRGELIAASSRDKGIHGYFLKSADEKNIAQFRLDGFTFSRLHPYTDWEHVFGEAMRLWDLYRSRTSPEAISRVAVRYINRIDTGQQQIQLSDYLTAPPVLPAKLPQMLSQFLIRLTVSQSDLAANILQTLDQRGEKRDVGIILDIDAFKADPLGLNEDSILETFERLHKLKNLIFFELITEKTAELFE